MSCPLITKQLIIAGDAQLAAQLSCALAVPGRYLPVIEGPNLLSPDPTPELVRRNNAAARLRPDTILLAGLSAHVTEKLTARLTAPLRSLIQRIATVEEIAPFGSKYRFTRPPLAWGTDRIGIGLLRAMREHRSIVFTAGPSAADAIPSKSGHLVVCEEGEPMAEVIAANYAYALRAGLCLIPRVERELSDQLLELFYSIYDNQDASPEETQRHLQDRFRKLTGNFLIPSGGSITFITGGLPYGFAFPDVPSTHLFKYPDLGIAMLNGFVAEQPTKQGIGFVALVDPQTTDAHEIGVAERILPPRGAFIRTYYGPGANVRDVGTMIELFPYDLLIISTHCGDSCGHRWTYEFTDSEGVPRTLVVDIAIGVGKTDDENKLGVTQFIRFISLDGVDWEDQEKIQTLYVGTAIPDFLKMKKLESGALQPVKRELVPRVTGSAALKMYDHNLIVMPRALAGEGTPIVINNACSSWHRLASNFLVSGARAYVGTLFPVTTTEAQEVIVKLLDKHYSKPLPAALWSAQRDVYGIGLRRPYVATGIYPQRLHVKRHDVIRRMTSRLSSALGGWRRAIRNIDPNDTAIMRATQEKIAFYERELAHFQNLDRSRVTRSNSGRKDR